MLRNNLGLTAVYNLFQDPSENRPDLLELRSLNNQMNKAVLKSYEWDDLSPLSGFGLDYLEIEDEAHLPDNLQEHIDDGELFFFEADEAINFESQLRSYKAIKVKKKLPWRYRWPDDVRETVLARLLALNAERYAEEVALDLHSKGKKKTASGAGKKRGRSANAAASSSSEQMGLGL